MPNFSVEVALDRIGAALGEALVVFFTADRVGMAGDDEGRTLQVEAESALPSSCTEGSESLLISAEL